MEATENVEIVLVGCQAGAHIAGSTDPQKLYAKAVARELGIRREAEVLRRLVKVRDTVLYREDTSPDVEPASTQLSAIGVSIDGEFGR